MELYTEEPEIIMANKSQERAVEYYGLSMQAYREGHYLESSRWARLAEYERNQGRRDNA